MNMNDMVSTDESVAGQNLLELLIGLVGESDANLLFVTIEEFIDAKIETAKSVENPLMDSKFSSK